MQPGAKETNIRPDMEPVCIVDLFPCPDDAKLRDLREFASQAWHHFASSESLRACIDATFDQERTFEDGVLTEIVWRTRKGQLTMYLLGDAVISLQAFFDPHCPCRELALFAAALANVFQLCAVTDLGTIRDADLMSFARTMEDHALSLRLQSNARH